MSLQSNADLRHLNRLLPVSSVFLSFQFLILYLLIFVCTQFHLLVEFHEDYIQILHLLFLYYPILLTRPIIKICRLILTNESISKYPKN